MRLSVPQWVYKLRWMRRGDARLLVLEALKMRPMYGYEVSKQIAQLFHGFYEPSPGVVYPTLQWLEDEGFVESTEQEGKRVYEVTGKGNEYYERNEKNVKRLLELGRSAITDEKLMLIRAGRNLRRTLILLYPEMTDEKAKSISKILDEARVKIVRLME